MIGFRSKYCSCSGRPLRAHYSPEYRVICHAICYCLCRESFTRLKCNKLVATGPELHGEDPWLLYGCAFRPKGDQTG